ncbi:hypothetical protein H6504_03255 [Candidatus Woesearchaeota archaeon]|nr:hypothetical protein [Candidatus Woesearchaeota archaeon]
MKKAQITLFIVIGMVILLIIGLTVFFNMMIQDEEREDPALAEYSGQEQTRSIVDSCLSEAVLEALSVMRFQGGFIDIPSSYKYLSLPAKYEIYTEDGLKKIRHNEDGFVNVPVYLSAENRLTVPSKRTLETQLEEYIAKAIPLCARGFADIEEYYGVAIETGNIVVQVDFEKEVIVEMRYDIRGKTQNTEWTTNEFAFSVPFDLDKMINYAQNIAIIEAREAFLERFILEMISLRTYMGGYKQDNDLPPFSLTVPSSSPSFVIWNRFEVEQKLRNMVSSTLPLLRIGDLKHPRLTSDDPVEQRVLDSYIRYYFPTDDLSSVSMYHDKDWFIPGDAVVIKPKEGGILRPSIKSAPSFLFFPTFHSVEYRFKYDVKLPILFKVHDYWSSHINATTGVVEGNGMSLYFLLETNLCGNQPRTCNNALNISEFYDIEMEEESNFCDGGTLEAQELIVLDAYTQDPIPGVEITYSCVDQDCPIGLTESDGRALLPLQKCINGKLQLKKEGYDDTEQRYSSTDAQGTTVEMLPLQNISLELVPVHARNLLIYAYLTGGFTRNTCDGRTPASLLESIKMAAQSDDNLLLTLRKENYIKFADSYSSDTTAMLAKGEYEIETVYLANTTITPSTYETGQGDSEKVGFEGEAPDYEPYIGLWPFGSATQTITLPKVQDGDVVTVYFPVEHSTDMVLEVKDFEQQVLQDAMLNMSIEADQDCDGTPEKLRFSLPVQNLQTYLPIEIR